MRGAAVMMALVAVGAGGWMGYGRWRAGEIELRTEGAPLVVQVLDVTSDAPIGEPIDLVDRAILTLPDGEYRLRVTGKGRVGRTYRFAVNRGERQLHSISLDEGRLLGGEPAPPKPMEKNWRHVPILFATVTAALELEPGKADFIQWSNGSLVRRDGSSGKVLWDAFHPASAFERKRDPGQWFPGKSPDENTGELMETAAEFDGDGTKDMLWYFREKSLFLALSGKDGSLLWHHVAELERAGADGPGAAKSNIRESEIAGKPAMMDVDHDGAADIVATVLFGESAEEAKRRIAETGDDASKTEPRFFRRVVMAISGKSGARLWSYAIDKEFTLPMDELRQAKPPAELMQAGRTSLIAVLDDEKWLGLDPATGRMKAGPIDLGFAPIRQVPHADLDGDGEPEVLTLGSDSAGVRQNTLRAHSSKTGELWSQEIGSAYHVGTVNAFERRFKRRPIFPACLLIADLDGDGRPEIVVADTGPMPPLDGSRGVRLIDGATGQLRWRRPMRVETTAEDGMAHIVAAPDLDGDGMRDVITVSQYDGRNPLINWPQEPDEPAAVFVDAFSGKDGRPLWWWCVDLPADRFTRIAAPVWWGRGSDGWPLLAVALGGIDPDEEDSFGRSYQVSAPVVHLLEASTGKEQHAVIGLTNASVADLNGDGLADLWGEVGGELRAFRGEAPEAWRALGQFEPAGAIDRSVGIRGRGAVDFDRDGIADTLVSELAAPGTQDHRTTGSRTAVARSGRDGHLIWKASIDPRELVRAEEWRPVCASRIPTTCG